MLVPHHFERRPSLPSLAAVIGGSGECLLWLLFSASSAETGGSMGAKVLLALGRRPAAFITCLSFLPLSEESHACSPQQ